MRAVLVDAGPLVALLDRSDAHHAACVETLKSISDPLVTVWPAFTEAMYLLGFSWAGQHALWEMIETESIKLAGLDHTDAPRMKTLMRKYRDLPMDLAAAALVAVAERDKVSKIFTLDRRHFRLYRPAGLGRFSILPSA
jgi:predicted nucleic acid-binding protein